MGAEKDRGGSSRGLRWGGASVSLAEVGCGRHEGVKETPSGLELGWGEGNMSYQRVDFILRVLVSSRKIFK